MRHKTKQNGISVYKNKNILKMGIESINIGGLIKEKVRERGMSIVQFAETIHKDRSGVYRIFNSQTIDTDLLVRISNVLDYNFFAEYCVGNSGKHPCSYLVITHENDNWRIYPLPTELQEHIAAHITKNSSS